LKKKINQENDKNIAIKRTGTNNELKNAIKLKGMKLK
jgi:hypothetical protein